MSTPRDGVGDLVGRYCDAVLRADTAAFADLWTADGQWLIAGRPPIVGPAAIAELFGRTRSQYRLCVQELLSGVVDPTPATPAAQPAPDHSRWTARWQVRELQWGGAESGDDSAQQLIGVYHDVVADDGGPHLRFAQRRFEVLYRGPIDLSGRLYTAPPLAPEGVLGG